MTEPKNVLRIRNFHCSEHGYIEPVPKCPKCHTPVSDKVQRGNCVFCGPVQGFSSMGDDIEIIHENHKRFHAPVSDNFTRDGLNNFIQESAERNDKILEKYLNGTPTPPPTHDKNKHYEEMDFVLEGMEYARKHGIPETVPDALTDTGWEQTARQIFANELIDKRFTDMFIDYIRTLLAEKKARMVEEVEDYRRAKTLILSSTEHQVIHDIIKAISK